MWTGAPLAPRSARPVTRTWQARRGPKTARDVARRRADDGAPRRSEDRGGCRHHAGGGGLPPGRRFDPLATANVPRLRRSGAAFCRPTPARLAGREVCIPRSSRCPCNSHPPEGLAVGWTLERPDSSSRASTPASFRLRRFSRPWRLAPLRAPRRVSAGHARGVSMLELQYQARVARAVRVRGPAPFETPTGHPWPPDRGPPKRSWVRPVPRQAGRCDS